MNIGTSYMNMLSKVSKTNKTSNYNQKEIVSKTYYSLENINKTIETIYEQRTDFSGSTDTIDPHDVQNILNSLSTNYNNIENLQPADIAYEDYKKMTYSSLEVIFNADSEKIGKASGLMALSQLTNDDVLNKIYFNNELEAKKDTKKDDYFFTLAMVSLMEMAEHIHNNGDKIILDLENNTLIDNSNLSTDTFTTKDKLFSDFDKFREYYEETKKSWTGAINMNEVFKNMDEIKELYAKRIEENNAILNSYTRTTKQLAI